MNSNSEWGVSLLYHYAGKMEGLMDKKYKTYNWNIEVSMQEEALRYETIRECLSDTVKDEDDDPALSGDEFVASSAEASSPGTYQQLNQHIRMSSLEDTEDPFNQGAAAIGKDGSMVLMKNSNLFPANNLASNLKLKVSNNHEFSLLRN